MEYSSWWRGMADLLGVVAEVGVALTVVSSLGRGGRRKWPNLVVIWQLGGGREGGFEITVQGGGWGVWCGPKWLEAYELTQHTGWITLVRFQPLWQLGSSTVVASCPWKCRQMRRSEGRQCRQHANLVLRPIERALRVASGRGEGCASLAAPGRGGAGGWCTGCSG